MANLKLSLGLIPSTSKIEQEETALIAEQEKLSTFSASDELARYNELDALVNSSDFKNKKKEIEGLGYKESEECHKEDEFKKLDKSKEMILYFKTRDGADLVKYGEVDKSGIISQYEDLGKTVSSGEFKQKQKMKPITFKTTEEYKKFKEYKKLKSDANVKKYNKLLKSAKNDEAEKLESVAAISKFKELEAFIGSNEFLEKKNMKPITFKDSEEYKTLVEYKNLQKNPDLKAYYKFKNSKAFAIYNEIDGSQKVSRYDELKEYLSSDNFKERKEYLLDKKRFEKSELFTSEQEYEKLRKSDDIVWYFKVKDSNKFDSLNKRELTFSDEFDEEKLDTKKWLCNHYWGDRLLNDRYSFEGDLHCYTESGNIDVRSSVANISTKPEKAEGRVWSPQTGGFRPVEFEYTSGIMNTGKSFRQKYGVFTAKIKLNTAAGPQHSFYMLADKMTPHIDICRTDKGKVIMDIFNNGNKPAKTSLGAKYSKNYFIYTLEWTAQKLIWKINGYEVFSQTGNIPDEEMYINFSGGLKKAMSGSSSMEIDWVRIYQWK